MKGIFAENRMKEGYWMNYKEAVVKADTLFSHEQIKLTDTIEVVHQDGSRMIWNHARFGWLDDRKFWFAVWTKHNGIHIGCAPDVCSVKKVETETLYFNENEV